MCPYMHVMDLIFIIVCIWTLLLGVVRVDVSMVIHKTILLLSVMTTSPETLSQPSYRAGYSAHSAAAGGYRGAGPGGLSHSMTNGYHSQHHRHGNASHYHGNASHHHAHPPHLAHVNPPHMSHHTPSLATPSTASTRSPQMSRRLLAASPQYVQNKP